jgi:release factor glutamine methyltransferase
MPDASAEWTIGKLIEWTRGFFEKKGIPQPRLEAEILLAHVLGMERIDLYLKYEQPVDEAQRASFRDLIRRRADREPTRYLVGVCEFMSLALKITPDCLIPRPETELLVEQVLALSGAKRRPMGAAFPGDAGPAPVPVRVIDLCTGSGCVAVSLAVHLPPSEVTAADLSPAALAVARENAEAHGVDGRIAFLEGDLYEPLDAADVQPADFLVANPPYVAEAGWAALAPEIREHEPRAALVAGPRGLEVVERIVKGAPAYLKEGGVLLVEIGAEQGRAAAAAASAVRGLADVQIVKDYANLDRILMARRAPKE